MGKAQQGYVLDANYDKEIIETRKNMLIDAIKLMFASDQTL